MRAIASPASGRRSDKSHTGGAVRSRKRRPAGRLGFAFIPPGNPAINARGELCDRWGTPFFFHQLSGSQMEIRSAGPDRKLWTPDDEVLTPGLRQPPL